MQENNGVMPAPIINILPLLLGPRSGTLSSDLFPLPLGLLITHVEIPTMSSR